MEIRLEPKIEKRVLENEGLIHHLLKQKSIDPSDYDDFFQIGRIGLIKAVMTFDETKSKFATYAGVCINNEINMHFRKTKNDRKNVSLDEPINEDDSGNILTLQNTISDEHSSNFTDTIENRETLERAISIILNCFSIEQSMVLLLSIGEVKQISIAKRIGISQSYVSRVIQRGQKNLKRYMNIENKVVNNLFSVKIEDNRIKISFFTKDMESLCEALENYAINGGEIGAFKINITDSKIEMCFLLDTTSFIYLANILQEMENAGVIIDDEF